MPALASRPDSTSRDTETVDDAKRDILEVLAGNSTRELAEFFLARLMLFPIREQIMSFLDFDPNLTNEQLEIGDIAHRCASEVMRPAGIALGRRVRLHGGNAMTKEYSAEMFLRDATAVTIADGENAFLSQLGAAAL